MSIPIKTRSSIGDRRVGPPRRGHPRRRILLVAAAALVLSASGTATNATSASAFEFQHDSADGDCPDRVDECATSPSLWYRCPVSCSRHLGREGNMAEERSDPEQFFNLKATAIRQRIGNHDGGSSTGGGGSPGGTTVISMEDNEGYITLYAVLPLLRGMAQYYYDAIEHIARVYKYTLVPMILPYPATATSSSSDDGDARTESDASPVALSPVPGSKSILLQPPPTPSADDQPDVLKYVLSRQVVAGNHFDGDTLALDRPTIFLISHNGMFIERLVAPTMETMERRIKVYEHVMEERPDL
jgi:hypothetical protein